jgi:hypothetical protein
MSDQEILDAAYNRDFGTCYYHTQCEGCACPFYVKVSHYLGNKGHDGNTGCLSTAAQVAQALRQLCEDGVCCCPQKAPTSVCPSSQRVWARDPLTGTCCEYANLWLAPSGWSLWDTQNGCIGGH